MKWTPASIGAWGCAAAMALFSGAGAATSDSVPGIAGTQQTLKHNGMVVEFSARPVEKSAGKLMEGSIVDVRFKIVDEASGGPLRGVTPGAWMDMAEVIRNRAGSAQKSCKDKVSLYLKGVVGIRPMLDLNSYFVVLMNKEASISVVDPLVTMAGVTSTFATTAMKQPGSDWVNHEETRRLFVTLPKADEVAVIETDNFKVAGYVAAGENPMRIALQPDRRFLWIGDDAAASDRSGVTVIDVDGLASVGFIPTGAGHHEIAFSRDSRHAFVTNRGDGTVSVVDVARRVKVKTLATGSMPLSVAYSALSRMAYVSDGKDGVVAVIDGSTLEVVKRLAARPGLGPLRVTPDGRFVLVTSIAENAVHVIDTASNELVQRIAIPAQPYQITFSETFAYVRSLGSERVSMINLATLGKGKHAPVQSFVAGALPPNKVDELVIADSVASAADEGTVLVVNPADNSTYYYREGMNAPSSSYRVYGSSARAVTVVDRSLKEVSPGVYAGRVKIPVAGRYDVAFMLESPKLLHCFSLEAAADPRLAKSLAPATVEFEKWPRSVQAGETLTLRFKLVDPATGKGKAGVNDAQALYFLAPGSRRTQTLAREIGDGEYEIAVKAPLPGAYYVHMGVPSLKLGFGKLPFFSLRALPPATAQRADRGHG